MRQYDMWDDLIAHNDFAQIVRWVNDLEKRVTREKGSHKRYNETQKQLAKIARTLLAKDEVEAIMRQAAEKELGE